MVVYFLIRSVVLKACTVSLFARVIGEVCSEKVAQTTLGSKSSTTGICWSVGLS